MGPQLVFVTLGEEGCYYQNAISPGYQPGYTIKVADTTGAGDSLCPPYWHV